MYTSFSLSRLIGKYYCTIFYHEGLVILKSGFSTLLLSQQKICNIKGPNRPNSFGMSKDLHRSEGAGDAKFPIFAIGNVGHDTAFFDILSDGREIKLPEGAILLGGTQLHESLFDNGCFRVEFYFRNLSTTQLGRFLLWSPCLPSTHSLLSENFHGFPLGSVCVADAQLHGKGRTNNVWESPQGCLMFSFMLQMDNGRTLPFLQYVVSIAIIEAIELVSSQKRLPTPPVKIKWPNDLYAKGMKIGGVLCTSTYSNKKFNVVVGVGLNVGNRQPTTCLDALLQDVADAPPFEREELLSSFFERFEVLLQVFCNEGFAPLENNYYEKWLHSGQTVVLEDRQEDNSVSEVSLVIQGLSPTGYLLATDNQMEKYELHPDGNSFDFLRGLVRTKLQP